MTRNIPSIAKLMKERGYSRREFLYLAGAVAAAAGLGTKDVPRVVRRLETAPRCRVLRVIFASGDEYAGPMSAAYLIANDLICETKCFALAGELTEAQTARLAQRIETASAGRDFLLLVEGAPSPDGLGVESLRTAAKSARSVVTLGFGPGGTHLFAAAASELIAGVEESDAPVSLIDSWETAAAHEGFAVYRAEVFGAPENLPRLPYRPAPDKQGGIWKPVGATSVPPRLSGVALHALTSNVPKHKLIRENMDEEARPFGGRAGADRANFARGGDGPQRFVTGDK